MPKMPAPFNPAKRDFDYVETYSDPVDCARALWEWPRPEDVENDFETVVEQAQVDPQVYDALWAWAMAQPNLDTGTKVTLFDALVRKKPRKGVAATEAREARLRFIANVLVKHYGLKRSHKSERHNEPTAATVLVQLRGVPARRRIENIITGTPPKP